MKKELINFEIKQCFFCDKYLIPQDVFSAEVYEYWKDRFGYIMKTGGSIGNKQLCRNCTSDIAAIVEGEKYDY